jgi:hypothetical protein
MQVNNHLKVYGNQTESLSEEMERRPITVLGQTMLAAENLILNAVTSGLFLCYNNGVSGIFPFADMLTHSASDGNSPLHRTVWRNRWREPSTSNSAIAS